MVLSWQQGPLAPGAVDRFLTPQPLPERILSAEPLRRRIRVSFGSAWIVDSEDVVLLHERGRYPVAYFLLTDVAADILEQAEHTTQHRDLGATSWYTVRAGGRSRQQAVWQHVDLPDCTEDLKARIPFARRAMDGFFEEDERIVGHAAAVHHRIDIRPPAGTSPSATEIRASPTASAPWSCTRPEPPRRQRAAEAGARAERRLARRGPQTPTSTKPGTGETEHG